MDYTLEQQNILMAILPPYLKNSIKEYEEGRKNKSTLLDCLWCEVYGSINSAMYDKEITKDEAAYLREKYLGLEPR